MVPSRLRHRAGVAIATALCLLTPFALPIPARADGGASLELPGGAIVIELLGDDGEVSSSGEVLENAETIGLRLRSECSDPVRVAIRLVADEVLGLEPGTVLRRQATAMREGRSWEPRLRPMGRYFEVGHYAIEAGLEGEEPAVRIPFEVRPLFPAATLLEGAGPDRINVALSALGGRVVSVSSSSGAGRWAAPHLVDGFSGIRDRHGSLVSAGWQSGSDPLPADVVLGFHAERAPIVDAVVVEPVADYALPPDFVGAPPRTGIPRVVEIQAADRPDAESFETIATARLWNRTARQLITFEARPIRFLRLRVVETYGGSTVTLGEVRVFEVAGATSILDDLAPNLALPALGGGLVSFTSQSRDNPAAALLDGQVDRDSGWSSAESTAGAAARLPQDLVFGFRGNRVAAIDHLVIDATSGLRYATGDTDDNWPRVVAIAAALQSPEGPFEELGRFELLPEPGPQTIPVGRSARYLRVRVLENHGGSHTSIGEIGIIGAAGRLAESVLVGPAEPEWSRSQLGGPVAELPAGRDEVEPNDGVAGAEPLALGEAVRARLETADDIDRFVLTVPGEEAQTVSVEVDAEGAILVLLDLHDGAGALIKHFSPDARLGHHIRLTWQLEPGVYVLTARQPERVTALVWDTSASMEGRTQALERAVRGYIDGAEAEERLVVIPFSDDAESLLPEPTADRDAVRDALEGHFRPDGGTHLFDAVAAALDALETSTGQRTIIALTDGQDSGSRTAPSDLRRRLASSDVQLVTIGLGPDLDSLGLATATTGHGVLRSLAQAGGGRYVVEPRADLLPDLYAAIAEELGSRRGYALRASLSEEIGGLEVLEVGERIPAFAEAIRVTLVLDASGSMARALGDDSMIDIARAVLIALTAGLPEEVEASLWTFGHRVREGRSGDCDDIEALVPLGPLDRERMEAALRGVRALGTTAIASTLERIGESLPQDDGRQLIVVVTDGEEECRDDLVAVAERLAAQHTLNLHVVGFALDQPALEEQLAAVAEAGGGRFVNAAEADSLAEAIEAALGAPFEVLDASGDVVAESTVGADALALRAGTYSLRVVTADEPFEVRDIDVVADSVATIRLDRQGEEVGVVVLSQ